MSVVFLLAHFNDCQSFLFLPPTQYFLFPLNYSSASRFKTSGFWTLPASEHLEGIYNSECWAFTPEVSNLVDLWQGQGICISNKFPDNPYAAGPAPWEPPALDVRDTKVVKCSGLRVILQSLLYPLFHLGSLSADQMS